MGTRARRALILALAFAGVATEARAQIQTPRPASALFFGSAYDPKITERLDAFLNVAGAYDGQAVQDTTGRVVPGLSPLQRSGFYNDLTGGLSYNWTGQRAQFGASGGASGRYYGQDGFLWLNEFVSAGLTAELTRRVALSVNQSISYSPPYFNSLTPGFESPALGTAVGAGSNYSVAPQQAYLYDTSVTISRALSPRSSFSVLAEYRFYNTATGYQLANTPTGYPLAKFKTYGVGGRYTRILSKSVGLRLGYVYREGLYGVVAGVPSASHDIDVGVDYKHALSFSKRTVVNFSVGSTILNSSSTAALVRNVYGVTGASALARNLQFGVTGNVGLTHDMGRTWRARLMYDRGLTFSEAVQGPIFADSIRANLGGLFSKRADFESEAAAFLGDVAYGSPTPASRLQNYEAHARVRFALASWAAVYTEYVYYRYSVGSAVLVTPGIPSLLNRNSVRLGLSFWAPLLRK